MEPLARAAADSGADAISLVNTFVALAIDARTRRPRLGAGFGGLSGPGIKPVALRMVYEAARAVTIPVIGLGGISTGEDAAEFMIAGAPRWRWAPPTSGTRRRRRASRVSWINFWNRKTPRAPRTWWVLLNYENHFHASTPQPPRAPIRRR